jgi:thioredoxin 1
MKDLTLEEFKTQIKSVVPIIIEFWSPLCSVCDKAEEYLEKLHYAYKNRISVAKINIDNASSLIEQYSIKKLPTFILFKNSEILTRTYGFKDGLELEKLIRTHIK